MKLKNLKSKHYIIAIAVFLILIIAIYFLFFQPQHTIILYIEGIEAEELVKYSDQELPNLKNLFSTQLKTQVPLNNPSSFQTLFSGKYIYQPWYLKNSADYCVQKENDFSGIFKTTVLNEYLKNKKQKVYFFNNLDWQTEKKIHQRNFSALDIIQKAEDNFKEQKNIFLKHLEDKQENWLIAGFNFPALVAQVSDNEQDILRVYRAIDDLIAQVQNLMKRNTNLYLISPFGLVPVKESVDINQALIYRGFLKAEQEPEENFSLNNCDLSDSYVYSPRAGEIFVNQVSREAQGKVSDEFEAVIEDTAYVLNFIERGEELISTQLYLSRDYFKSKEVGELLIAMPSGYNIFWPENNCSISKDLVQKTNLIQDHLNIQPNLISGLILANKEFVQDNYDYLDVLDLVLRSKK